MFAVPIPDRLDRRSFNLVFVDLAAGEDLPLSLIDVNVGLLQALVETFCRFLHRIAMVNSHLAIASFLLDLLRRADPGREELRIRNDLLAKCGLELRVVSRVADVVALERYWLHILELLLSFTLFPLTWLLALVGDSRSQRTLTSRSRRMRLRHCLVAPARALRLGLG